MHHALQDQPKLCKRQKLYVQAETKQGKLLWQAATRVRMDLEEEMQVRFRFGPPDVGPPSGSSSSSSVSMEEMEVTDFDALEQEVQAQDDEVLQLASQVDPQVMQVPPEPGYASMADLYKDILNTRNGRAWYIAWKQGRVDDSQVDTRFGPVVLRNFQSQARLDDRQDSQQSQDAVNQQDRRDSQVAEASGSDATGSLGSLVGPELPSGGSAQLHGHGGQVGVGLSAPTQLVQGLYDAGSSAVGPSSERTCGDEGLDEDKSGGGLLGASVDRNDQDVAAGEEAGPAQAAVASGPAETAEDEDELSEMDSTIADTTTWYGRAMDRWQREGHLY